MFCQLFFEDLIADKWKIEKMLLFFKLHLCIELVVVSPGIVLKFSA